MNHLTIKQYKKVKKAHFLLQVRYRLRRAMTDHIVNAFEQCDDPDCEVHGKRSVN